MHEIVSRIEWAIASVLFSFAIVARSYRKKSLDLSGAITAFFVGFVALNGGIVFAVVLFSFFFGASKITKVRQDIKKNIEDHFREGGQRNWEQVIANGGFGTVLCLLYQVWVGAKLDYFDVHKDPLAVFLLAAYIGQYACCNGDTFASELGILSKQQPRHILTLKRVPRGTNGGVTLFGLFVSAIGGLIVGLSYFLSSILVICNSSSTRDLWANIKTQSVIIPIACVAGLQGSILDSIIGATLEYSGFDKSQGKVLASDRDDLDKLPLEHISGIRLLSGSNVNFLSAALTGLIIGVASLHIF